VTERLALLVELFIDFVGRDEQLRLQIDQRRGHD